MVKTYVTGFPRIGENRELKRAVEGYFKGKLNENDLEEAGSELRKKHWYLQKSRGIDYISSNDFSFYDGMLDMAVLLNIIPERYKELPLSDTGKYFAMARGYQEKGYDVKAMEMKKWFNTNYHYVVPEIEENTQMRIAGTKPFDEFLEALNCGFKTKPVIIGPFTFLKLAKINTAGRKWSDFKPEITRVYSELLREFNNIKTELLQIDEPYFVMDLSLEDKKFIVAVYQEILKSKGEVKILLNTYFGDIRDIYDEVISMDFDAVGIDFIEGEKSLELLETKGFDNRKVLFAGVVNGKNIWKNDYEESISNVERIIEKAGKDKVVVGTSCSLLHVPYTLKNEKKLNKNYKEYLAFAEEKLGEIGEIGFLCCTKNPKNDEIYKRNIESIKTAREDKTLINKNVKEKVVEAEHKEFYREARFEERIKKQKSALNLPLLPSTTIGSFPQTQDIRTVRKGYKDGKITESEYIEYIKDKTERIVKVQEEIGLDVLVHGEYERNDMVEYFGENMNGFIFTENGWVQSYGVRGVKPPIIIGDVSRKKSITADWIGYAQSITKKVMKGMLTGPVTILNWSFPREDITRKEIAYQIGFAIKEEVKDLETKGIKIIQIDEAAMREKLPLRKCDWETGYLEWAVKSFRITCSDVEESTQIHSHFCYSEFADIMKNIDEMDADVITIEAAKSDLKMLDVLEENGYNKESGPGLYDIHSPRVPTVKEFEEIIKKMAAKLGKDKLWINPDCGLKTRGEEETFESLRNMVEAAKRVRKAI